MANPLDKKLEVGSVGELLVIIRLLQHGVQASFTLKDTGNDLIGVRGTSMRTIQVKTSFNGQWKAPGSGKTYGVLALVSLKRSDPRELALDRSKIYVLSRPEVGDRKSFNNEEKLVGFLLSQERVHALFQ